MFYSGSIHKIQFKIFTKNTLGQDQGRAIVSGFALGMWIPVKFIQEFRLPLRIRFEKNQEGSLMKKIIMWIKLNWIKLLVAIISGIITYELLDWIYIQNL